MPISDWHDLMPHTITHQAVASRDEYGVPTYGTGTSYTARVVYKNSRIKSQRRGSETDVIADGHIWISGTPTINVDNDRITLPDNSTPILLSVERWPDESGLHHVKVYFGEG